MSSILRYFLIAGLIVLGMFLIASDVPVIITIKHYVISISILSLVGLIIILYLMLRALSLIILSPYRLFKKIFAKTLQIPVSLLEANNSYLINDISQSKKLIANITSDKLSNEALNNLHLLQALITEGDEQKILYFKQLAEKNNDEHIKFLAYCHLAQIYYNNNTYPLALDYASKALSIVNNNEELITIALSAASKLEKWNIVQSLISNLENSPTTSFNLQQYCVGYCIKIAQYKILTNNIEEALIYLELALRYKPDDTGALALYYTVNSKLNLPERNLKVLESALILKPSLELFIMYHNSQPPSLDAQHIFENFLQLIKVDHSNIEALIAISAYYRLAYFLEQLTNQLKHAYNNPTALDILSDIDQTQ